MKKRWCDEARRPNEIMPDLRQESPACSRRIVFRRVRQGSAKESAARPDGEPAAMEIEGLRKGAWEDDEREGVMG